MIARVRVKAHGALALGLMLLAPLAIAQTGEQVWGYKVKPGDRLVDIAKTYQKNPEDWKKLQQKNAVPEPKLLAPGKIIQIPVSDLKQGDPVAEALLVHGDVQRLDKNGQPAGKLTSGDVLKMGEMVQTSERSTLTLRFADASRMLVTEKSKISLSSLVNYGKTGMADTKIQVHQGGTDSQVSPQKGPASRYEINTPAINLTVRGTGFRVTVDEGASTTRTEVVEGQVGGASDTGQALIGNGYGIIAAVGKPLGTPSRLLPAPVLDAADGSFNRIPVRFAWQELPGATRYRLQLLARVQGSEALIVDEVIPGTSVQWDSLPDGNYLFRVRGIDAQGLEGSDAQKPFRLGANPSPPVLTAPLHQASVQADKIFFQWEAAEQADTYLFQLAEDPEFSRVVALVPRISASTRGVLLALPPGRYFWRAASVLRDGEAGPYGDAFSFNLTGIPAQGQ